MLFESCHLFFFFELCECKYIHMPKNLLYILVHDHVSHKHRQCHPNMQNGAKAVCKAHDTWESRWSGMHVLNVTWYMNKIKCCSMGVWSFGLALGGQRHYGQMGHDGGRGIRSCG